MKLSFNDYIHLRFISKWKPYNPYPMLPDDKDTVGTIYKGMQYWRFESHSGVVIFSHDSRNDNHNWLPFYIWLPALVWRWNNA